MDSAILGLIGLPELLLILIIAILVMGPAKMRQAAYTLGRYWAKFQIEYRHFMRRLNAELDSIDAAELDEMRQEVANLRREIDDMQRSIDPNLSKNANRSPASTEGQSDAKPTLPQPIQVPDDPDA